MVIVPFSLWTTATSYSLFLVLKSLKKLTTTTMMICKEGRKDRRPHLMMMWWYVDEGASTFHYRSLRENIYVCSLYYPNKTSKLTNHTANHQQCIHLHFSTFGWLFRASILNSSHHLSQRKKKSRRAHFTCCVCGYVFFHYVDVVDYLIFFLL